MVMYILLSSKVYAEDVEEGNGLGLPEGTYSETEDATISDFTNVKIGDGNRLFVKHQDVGNKFSTIKFSLEEGKSYVINFDSQFWFKITSPSGSVVEERNVTGYGLQFLSNGLVLDAEESGEYTYSIVARDGSYTFEPELEVYQLYDSVEDVGYINLNLENEGGEEYYYYAVRADRYTTYTYEPPEGVVELRSVSPVRNSILRKPVGDSRNPYFMLDSYTPLDMVTKGKFALKKFGAEGTYAHVHEWEKVYSEHEIGVIGKTYLTQTGEIAREKIKELKAEDRGNSLVADPIDSFAGNYIDERTLLTYSGNNALDFSLSYDSIANESIDLGGGYTHNFETYLDISKEDEGNVDYYPTPNSVVRTTINEEGKYLPKNKNQIGLEIVKIEGNDSQKGYSLKDKEGNKSHFNTEGNILYKEDKLGNRITYKREQNKLTQVINERGQYYNFTYNEEGKLAQVKDEIRELNFTYNEKGELVLVELPNKDKLEMEYSNSGRLYRLSQNGIRIVSNVYDSIGRIKSQGDGNGTSTSFDYDEYSEEGKKTTEIDTSFNKEYKTHDNNGNLISEEDELGKVKRYEYDDNRNLVGEIDKNGNKTSYEYDSSNRLIKEINADNTYKTYEYDTNNNLIGVVIEDGSKVVSEYNENNQLVKMTDVLGNETHYKYDTLGNITAINREGHSSALDGKITTLVGYSVESEYDSRGNLISVNNGEGITQFEYDDLGREIKTILPNGNTIQKEYDLNGNIVKLVNSNGEEELREYNTFGDLISETDLKGIKTEYTYDNVGNLTRETRLDRDIRNTYDKYNNLKEVKLIDGETEINRKVNVYNKRGELTTIRPVYPVGGNIGLTYDDTGNLIQEDDNNKRTDYEYNSLNQLVKEIESNGNEIIYTYDEVGNIVKVTSNGKDVNIEYDKKGRILSEEDMEGNTTNYEYDVRGNILKETLPNGAETHYTYNANNDITKITNALQEVEERKYNELGQLSEVLDDNGDNVFEYEYDKAGNVKTLIDGNGNSYTFKYDALNNLTTVIDSLGNTVEQSEYNEFNQLIESVNEKGKTTYTKDIYGNKTKEVDAKGNETNLKYNSLGNLETVSDSYGTLTEYAHNRRQEITSIKSDNVVLSSYTLDTSSNITRDSSSLGSITREFDLENKVTKQTNGRGLILNYKYNKNNQLISEISEEESVNSEYDNVGNLVKVEDSIGITTFKYDLIGRVISKTQNGEVIGYEYDNVGNISKITYPNNKEVNYTYDNVGNILTVTDWHNNKTSYEYDKNGRLVKTTNSNSVEEYRSYNNFGQLTQIKRVNGETELDVINYQYDILGNIIKENDNEYIYDKLNRLTQANENTYAYDSRGNITEFNIKGLDTYYTKLLTYGNSNELKSLDSLAVQVDKDGNLETYNLNGETYSAKYDSKNRMISFDGLSYEYDSLGNRVKVSEEESGKETTYLVDNVSGKYSQNIVETTTKDSKTDIRYNIFGNGLIGTYVEDSKESIILNHYDIRGSTVLVTDYEGNVTHNIYYDEYGKLQTDLESLPTQYLYNGQFGVQTDTNSLNYMMNRYYNSDLKRFMNKDILVGELDKPTTLNRYSYVNGDPISYIDPYGLARESISGNLTRENIHLGLDLLGFAPVVGFVPDLLNSVLYLSEGNVKEAVWSGIGAVPFVGDSTSALRLSNKVVNKPDLYFEGVGKVDKVSKSGKGYIKYGELDSLGRATTSESYLTKDMLGTGSGARGSIKPAGYVSEKIGKTYKYHRGHLIANTLGGTGTDIRNLTTLHAKANSPEMWRREKNVREAVRRGENVKYKVEPVYKGEEVVPRGVTMYAEGDKGFKQYLTILNRRN